MRHELWRPLLALAAKAEDDVAADSAGKRPLDDPRPANVSMRTSPRGLSIWLQDQVSKREEATLQYMGNKPGYTAVKAGIYAWRRVEAAMKERDGRQLAIWAPTPEKVDSLPTSRSATQESPKRSVTRYSMRLSLLGLKRALATDLPPIFVAGNTNVGGLAGAIKKRIKQAGVAEVYATGPAKVGNFLKAMRLVDEFYAQDGMDARLAAFPDFEDLGEDARGDGEAADPMFKVRFRCQTAP